MRVEGRPLAPGGGGTFVTVRRTWRDGDTLVLRLPLEVTLSHPDGDAIALERGPLV